MPMRNAPGAIPRRRSRSVSLPAGAGIATPFGTMRILSGSSRCLPARWSAPVREFETIWRARFTDHLSRRRPTLPMPASRWFQCGAGVPGAIDPAQHSTFGTSV